MRTAAGLILLLIAAVLVAVGVVGMSGWFLRDLDQAVLFAAGLVVTLTGLLIGFGASKLISRKR